MPDRILAESRYLRLVDRDGWTFVERPNARGVVTLVAITPEKKLLLVEQLRRPFERTVIELPAGLVGDEPQFAHEDMATAAARELQEETGYATGRIELLATCCSSAGMSNEMVSFYLATDLVRVSAGGGTPDENITVHEIPLSEVRAWLRAHLARGQLVAAKVYAGLLLLDESGQLERARY